MVNSLLWSEIQLAIMVLVFGAEVDFELYCTVQYEKRVSIVTKRSS